MSIPGTASLWEKREEALRVCIRQVGHTYTVPDGLLDEDTVLSRFGEFSRGLLKGRRLQLFNKLHESCGSIIKISREICKHGPDNGRPESLVWKIIFAALELGLVCLQVALLETVPKLDNLVSNLSRWSGLQLQDNLEDMYDKFINSYMDLINAYGTKRFDPNLDLRHQQAFHQQAFHQQAFGTIIEEARLFFSNAENSYKQKIKSAEESEAANSAGLSNASFQPLTEFRLDFQIQKTIGTGSHSTVYQVQETTTQELYACKDVQWTKPSLKGRSQIEVKEEISVLKRLRHTHIVTISTYCQERTGVRILMEPLADRDLKDFLIGCAEKNFPAEMTKMILPWFACLLHALDFAHHEKVKHRDIKLANILLKGSHIYLSDFSLAKDFADQDTSVAVGEEAKGTMKYRAPETKNNVAGGRKADVFSLGCVYSEMLTVVCRRPFKKLCERRKAEHKTDLFRDSLPAVKKWLRELRTASPNDEKEKVMNMCKIIQGMLEEETDMRHSAHQALISVEESSELRCAHVH